MDAITQFQKALSLNPNDAEAHQNLGVLLAQTGHVPEAMAHLQEAVRLKPNYALARANIAKLKAMMANTPATNSDSAPKRTRRDSNPRSL